MTSLRHMAVVVPARNEQDHIAGCLRSIRVSVDHLQQTCPHISCDIVVVLDCCTDRTADIAVDHGGRTVVTAVGRVGAARHLGALEAMACARRAGIDNRATWLANTDADTLVPEDWLATQYELADAGYDAVIGTVTPEGLDLHRDRVWRQHHRLIEGHDHIHGANLGLRANTYCKVGGFAAVSLHEDLDLVNRIKASTSRWAATHRTNVCTSARTESRVIGGFASYVADLGSEDSTCA